MGLSVEELLLILIGVQLALAFALGVVSGRAV